jgi:fructosamine-3-kinase
VGVTFTNEPKLSEHEVDRAFNERRVALAKALGPFIATHSIFKDKDVAAEFAHKGISSLISIIDAEGEKFVLKIPLSTDYAAGEALFLKVWEQAGVKVPHIFDEGSIDGHPYIIMEYVDAPLLVNAHSHEELVEKGLYKEMGRTLRLMHTPKAEGYGKVVHNKAEFASFKEWLVSPDMERRVEYVQRYNLLAEKEHGALSDARDILLTHVEKSGTSSYCHDDFGSSNIFATDPLTVFDPNPRFNNGYIDLGRSYVNTIAAGKFPTGLKEGYFEGELCNEKTLHASIFLNMLTKLPYKHKTNRTDLIENMQTYLANNKHFLS